MSVTRGLLNIVMPLGLLVPFVLVRRSPNRVDLGAGTDDSIRLVGRQLLLLALLMAATALAENAYDFRRHYFYVFVLFPLWAVGWAAQHAVSAQAFRLLGIACVGIAIVGIGALAARHLAGRGTIEFVRLHQPYDRLAASLKAEGFSAGTVVAFESPYDINGNLRAYFPATRFVTIDLPHYEAPLRTVTGQCLLLWTLDQASSQRDGLLAQARIRLGIGDERSGREGTIALPLANGGSRTTAYGFWLSAGVGTCR
ncbi:MAG: hypothetical protein EXQ91_09425 [Alphaproteobacteria bacterium]|nr:hypothetical protein [Alphaproteobacteria bacterium]